MIESTEFKKESMGRATGDARASTSDVDEIGEAWVLVATTRAAVAIVSGAILIFPSGAIK
jgi:hypothetical protein